MPFFQYILVFHSFTSTGLVIIMLSGVTVSGVIGVQIFYIRHLNHKQHISPIALLRQPGQPLQVLDAPLGRRIRKGTDPVMFQRHALHF